MGTDFVRKFLCLCLCVVVGKGSIKLDFHHLKTLGRDKSRILYQNSVRPASQLDLKMCLRAETQGLRGKDHHSANSQGDNEGGVGTCVARDQFLNLDLLLLCSGLRLCIPLPHAPSLLPFLSLSSPFFLLPFLPVSGFIRLLMKYQVV